MKSLIHACFNQLQNNFLLVLFVLLCAPMALAQHGIGTTRPNPNAALHIEGVNQGVLLAKAALTTSTVFFLGVTPTTAHNGMIIYNTSTANTNGLSGQGYYIWEGGASGRWNRISTADAGAFSLIDTDRDTQIQVEEGADDDTIRFDTEGTERMVITDTGNVGIGTATPTQSLTVSGTAQITGAIYDSSGDAGIDGQVLSSTSTGTNWISSVPRSVRMSGTSNVITNADLNGFIIVSTNALQFDLGSLTAAKSGDTITFINATVQFGITGAHTTATLAGRQGGGLSFIYDGSNWYSYNAF